MKQKVEIWNRVESKPVADCRVFRVREDFCVRDADGGKATFFVIENPDWVNVIALTPGQEVVIIEQYRHGAEEITMEIPGGMIDENESPETAAKRELTEETGYSSDEFVFLGKSLPNPALQNNTIYHYLATNCEKTAETNFDEHESIATKLVPLSEIENLIETENINHSHVLACFYRYELYRKMQQKK
jgi:8-oxo-dGTP pyrophosphatase MutT (NUDIX family)